MTICLPQTNSIRYT